MNLEHRPSSYPNNPNHLPWLDGLRGVAALWVLVSHILILTGVQGIPVLSWGSLAVDLFMLLSGFLMAHHYVLRQHKEPWERKSTFLTFWIRRLFRIAPLYYFLLFVALALGPWLGENREAIASIWPVTATPITRYTDQSLTNILMHLSFIFGVIPEYAFRTPLPDWSIGLEMSFYLSFPFLMLAVSRFGPIKAGLVVVLICFILKYVYRDFFHQFEMPSFLALKLYIFFIGMWIAISKMQGSMRNSLIASLAILVFVCVAERSDQSVARIFLVIGMFYLMNNGSLPSNKILENVVEKIRIFFSTPLSKFLGDTSYGVYLVHLVLVIPIAGMLTTYSSYLSLNGFLRFSICFLIALPIVYLISWVLYRTIEIKGIQLGKAVVQRIPGINKS